MKKEDKVYTSFDEIEKEYFPDRYREKQEAKLTPAQLGEKWAKESFEKYRFEIQTIFNKIQEAKCRECRQRNVI